MWEIILIPTVIRSIKLTFYCLPYNSGTAIDKGVSVPLSELLWWFIRARFISTTVAIYSTGIKTTAVLSNLKGQHNACRITEVWAVRSISTKLWWRKGQKGVQGGGGAGGGSHPPHIKYRTDYMHIYSLIHALNNYSLSLESNFQVRQNRNEGGDN